MSLWRALAASRPRPFRIVSELSLKSWRCSSSWTRPVEPLTRSLRRFLNDDQHRAALQHFYRFMEHEKLSNESRFNAYVKSWALFARSGHLSDARDIYGRMEAEGFVPPVETSASMSALLSLAAEDMDGFASCIEKAFTHEDFDQRCLRHLIRNIAFQSHYPPRFYDDLVALYIDHRPGSKMEYGTSALLAYIRARRGHTSDSEQDSTSRDEDFRRKYSQNTREDIQTLLQLSCTDPSAAPVIHSAIRRLEITGQGPDRVFYNNMISVLLRRKRYDEVFKLYRSMMLGDATVLPDAYTFAYILRAVASYSVPRSIHSRQHKKPEYAPSPRYIFRDMLHCHLAFSGPRRRMTKRSGVLTGSTLNKAIQLLVDAEDYAGAYVALGTFGVTGLPSTLATYRAVLGGIIARMQLELPQLSIAGAELRKFWTYRFMGSPETIPHEIDVRTLTGILHFAQRRDLVLNPISLPTPEEIQHLTDEVGVLLVSDNPSQIPEHLTHIHVPRARYPGDATTFAMPSAVAVLGILDPPNDCWSTTPLRRLVRRALIASRPRVFLKEARVVSIAIKSARSEMVPASLKSRWAVEDDEERSIKVSDAVEGNRSQLTSAAGAG